MRGWLCTPGFYMNFFRIQPVWMILASKSVFYKESLPIFTHQTIFEKFFKFYFVLQKLYAFCQCAKFPVSALGRKCLINFQNVGQFAKWFSQVEICSETREAPESDWFYVFQDKILSFCGSLVGSWVIFRNF